MASPVVSAACSAHMRLDTRNVRLNISTASRELAEDGIEESERSPLSPSPSCRGMRSVSRGASLSPVPRDQSPHAIGIAECTQEHSQDQVHGVDHGDDPTEEIEQSKPLCWPTKGDGVAHKMLLLMEAFTTHRQWTLST